DGFCGADQAASLWILRPRREGRELLVKPSTDCPLVCCVLFDHSSSAFSGPRFGQLPQMG
ncbi:unnamed protein product, partial [Musa acuminata subsp. burmannicoides]